MMINMEWYEITFVVNINIATIRDALWWKSIPFDHSVNGSFELKDEVDQPPHN